MENFDFLSVILGAFVGAVPALALSGWSLFVAYAAKTEATWDDWLVARFKDIARGVLKDEFPPAPPAA